MRPAFTLATVLGVLTVGAFFGWRASSTPTADAAIPRATASNASSLPNQEPPPIEPETTHAVEPAPEQRAVVQNEPQPAAAEAVGPKPPAAIVRVRVFGKEHGEPIAGEQVFLRESDVKSWSCNNVDGSHASLGQCPSTDADGRASFDVEPGKVYVVGVSNRASDTRTELPELSDGETREVELAMATEVDRKLFGRIVDADDGHALADGVISFDVNGGLSAGSGGAKRLLQRRNVEFHFTGHQAKSPQSDIHARPDGTFELAVRSWEQRFALASATGYSRLVFALEQGHDTPETAFELRLSRAATLELVVRDGALLAQGAAVELSTDAYYLQQRSNGMNNFFLGVDPVWRATTDAQGRTVIGDLAPRAPLTLVVQVAGNAPRAEADPITLEPGEQRRVEVSIGSGAAVAGVVEDEQGQPVPNLEIWRVAETKAVPKLLEPYKQPAATARSGGDGRFEFDDVPPGIWVIGPRPISRYDARERTPDALVGLAQPVTVDASSRRLEVKLRVDRGLYIRGKVLAPSGETAAEQSVSASMENIWLNEYVDSDADGDFVLGPLPAGSYTLRADFARGKYAPSNPVFARAGDSDVVLRMKLGGAIRGRVIDAGGALHDGQLMLSREGGAFGWWGTSSRDGKFEFGGQEPGTYTLSASTNNGQFGMRSGLVVRAGETLDDVDVVLEQAAQLTLRSDAAEGVVNFQVVRAGTVVCADGLEHGTSATHTVPIGDIEVRWTKTWGETPSTQTLTLAAGEQRKIVWTGKP